MSIAAASVHTSELAAIVGEKHVVDSPKLLTNFSIDGIAPAASITPGSVDEAAAVLRYAYERDLVVVPAGGFIHQETGNTPQQIDLLLRTDRLTTIEHYDPGDLTIGVGAGVTISDLQNLVRDQGQVFPLDIAHPDRVTIGGAMAVAAHGSYKHAYGGLRDFCLGIRFITADGKIGKAGGRVVKNVAGFDIMKLMIGSYGTLGLITSASFKLFPLPAQTRTYICEFGKLEEANEFRDWLVNSPFSPIAIELLSPSALESHAWTLAIRATGSDQVLARYKSELGSSLGNWVEGPEEQRFWGRLENLGSEAPVTVSVYAPPQASGSVFSALERIASENRVDLIGWGRIGIGSLMFALLGGMAENYVGAIAALRATLPKDASTIVTRCPVALKPEMNIWGTTPTNLAAMKAVKCAFNAKDNLNRGRFLL
jgi:glycolate dehydrogenase FAD-binding subunit